MTKVYAVADEVPEDTRSYLTAGKEYPLLDERKMGFHILDDNGCRMNGCWRGSAHLDGGNWRRVER